MEKINFQSTERILKKSNRAVENLPNEEEVSQSIERLKKPFGKFEYKDSGLEIIEFEGKIFRLRYSDVYPHLITRLKEYLEIEGLSADDVGTEINNWKFVDSLRFILDGKEFDLLKLVPKSYNVFFKPSSTETHGAVMRGKDIFISADIATPVGIATLMHEIGHIVDDIKLEVSNLSDLTDGQQYYNVAEKVRKERAANAYALKVMRPFLSTTEQKSDLRNFLINYALRTYNVDAVEVIKNIEYHNGEAGHFAPNFELTEYDLFYNDFVEWKKTPEYKKLKDKIFTAGTEEEEEFGVWLEWVRKNQYSYEDDLYGREQ